MRILYLIRNNAGACIQAKRFLEHLDKQHEVMIAAWDESSYCFDNVDLLLNLVHNLKPNAYYISSEVFEAYKAESFFPVFKEPAINFLNEAKRYKPNLIISDYERLASYTANVLNVPCWYFSGTHIYDGLKKKNDRIRYFHYMRDVNDSFINRWKKHDTYIYSGYNEFSEFCEVNKGYTLTTPYFIEAKRGDKTCELLVAISNRERAKNIVPIISNLQSDVAFFHTSNDRYHGLVCYNLFDKEAYSECLYSCNRVLTDDINVIYDALYNKKNVIITPKLKDYCEMAHASILKDLDIAVDIGQVELMVSWGVYEVEKAIAKKLKPVEIFEKPRRYLHEYVEDYANECSI